MAIQPAEIKMTGCLVPRGRIPSAREGLIFKFELFKIRPIEPKNVPNGANFMKSEMLHFGCMNGPGFRSDGRSIGFISSSLDMLG